MKEKVKLKPETYESAKDFLRIGKIAAREAQEENHRLGLPNIYSRNGKIIYEMPDGEIIVKENSEVSEINEAEREKFGERLKNYNKNPNEGITWNKLKEKINND